jgi:biopolymer transport protein ExbD
MSMSMGSGTGVKSDINVTPMIDVMLVLLIIFMIVTPVLTSGFQATMPQAKNLTPAAEEDGDVVLGIDKDGDFFLNPGTGNIGPVSNKATPDAEKLAALQRALTAVYQNRTKDKILYFKADQHLHYQRIQDALELARKAGVRVLAAITEEKRDLFGKGK